VLRDMAQARNRHLPFGGWERTAMCTSLEPSLEPLNLNLERGNLVQGTMERRRNKFILVKRRHHYGAFLTSGEERFIVSSLFGGTNSHECGRDLSR
jgi:hypothetical protein